MNPQADVDGLTDVDGLDERKNARTVISPLARDEFLSLLAAGWTVTKAAGAAGFARQRFYELRSADEAFAARWEQAYEAGTDVLRDEIRRRAVDGWDEPVFHKGEQVGSVRKFSDTLLIFEMKRRDPAYRDNARLEVTGAGGGPVEVAAGYQPPTLADMVKLAGELGVLDSLGYERQETIDGDAVEVVGELPGGM